MKNIIKLLLPPIFLKILRFFCGVRFVGRYSSWQKAKQKSCGYEDSKIFDKVKNASLQVKNGKFACERDSVLFDKPQYCWSSLACLMYIAAVNKGNLSVLDFGGSLGSYYFTIRKFLKGLNVDWSIVEQKHFVEFGKKNLSDDRLSFYYDIQTCKKEKNLNVIFLSSVLHYLEKPYEWLTKFIDLGCDYILIDRMPFSKRDDDFIQIQKISSSIYKATYPLHIMKECKLIDFMEKNNYDFFESFDLTIFSETNLFYPKGLLFIKNKK